MHKQQAKNQHIPSAVHLVAVVSLIWTKDERKKSPCHALHTRTVEISALVCMRKLATIRARWRRVKAVCHTHIHAVYAESRAHKVRASAVLSLSIAAKGKFAQEHSYVTKMKKQTNIHRKHSPVCVCFFSCKDYGANWNKQNIHPHD